MGFISDGSQRARSQRRAAAIGLVKVVVALIASGALMFLSAGRLDWTMGWVFLGLGLGGTLASVILLPADLLAERSGVQEGAKSWDVALALLMARVGALVTLIVAGLDMRFGWGVGTGESSHSRM